jgi:hypothetical protein
MEMHGSAGRKMKHASCVGTIYMYFFFINVGVRISLRVF